MTAGTVAAGALGGVAGYSISESEGIGTNPFTVCLERLPSEFNGLRIALLTDLHHGYFITREHIDRAVQLTISLKPDLILLAGDFIHNDPAYIAPVMAELGKLRAPLGVFAVQGNRDIKINRMMTSQELAKNDIHEITNRGCWIQKGNSRFWLCGLDDCTLGRPDFAGALKGFSGDGPILALTHSPHLADSIGGMNISLLMCGHTHGGQLNLPLIGRPFIPKGCENYPCGLIQGPHSKVFVSVGVGSVFPAMRLGCPPEVALLTLANA